MPGYILYEDTNLVAIMTIGSKNPKTGPMDQVWILDRHNDPLFAYRNGLDNRVCGSCIKKSKAGGGDGSCYVQTGFAPLNVWKAYSNGSYNRLYFPGNYTVNELKDAGRNRSIRLGAYGDPALIPTNVWVSLLAQARMWTGYTHMWKRCDPALKNYCMASVDTMTEAYEAQRLGWRTFRVSKSYASNNKTARERLTEARCPGSKEAGNKRQCINCPPELKCSGYKMFNKQYNIVIKEH